MTSIYIHIPFCNTICSYCDFCKFIYTKKWVEQYLVALEKEINARYKNETIGTIYVGGGTPSSLSLEELTKLFSIISKFKLSKDYEFTFECNIESITKEKAIFLFKNKVNRLSIGVETFNKKYLSFLNRHHKLDEVKKKINMLKQIGFNNINIDLIYALPKQTLNELNEDIDEFLKLGINHISTYSLMIEPHTKLYIDKINTIDEDLDYQMYNLICQKLKDNGFIHYEISNFSKLGYQSKHNLVYWQNLEYYGFGVGASGYVDGIRYDNTKNLTKYLKSEWLDNKHLLSLNEKIENEFILGLRKINGINIKDFSKKYGFDVLKIDVVKQLLETKKLELEKNNLFINPAYFYIQNEILINFMGVDYERKINCN
ncbi:MAG: radical SAM family heme chaperone HemW [Bacilli bacterium]|nr:radical SAM family heme chaperone HemW [Bacilli bacterium]